MQLKIILSGVDAEPLLDMELKADVSKEDGEKIRSFGEREIESYLIEFVPGVKSKQVQDFDEIMNHPELVKCLTVKLRV
jgi:hypothetical protein